MANIRSIGDYNQGRGNQRGFDEGSFQGRNGEVPDFLSQFMVEQSNRPHPRKETFLGMLKSTFCP